MRRVWVVLGAAVATVAVAGCSSPSRVPAPTLVGIGAASSACQHIMDATAKSHQGDTQGLQTAMDAAARAASDAAQSDKRWKQFAADVYAVDQGAATADQSKHIVAVCAQLQKDSSVYVTATP
ncbi:MAG TPA: hypothetical protein VIM19_09615 [Actinomycetes bacterium]